MSMLENLYIKPERKNYEKLINLIRTEKKLRILDVGCGDGNNTRKIFKYCPNAKIYGIDFDSNILKKASKNRIITAKVDLENERFPFNDNHFDIVISNMVIEHVDDLDFFISEQRRILKRNGRIIISTNNASSWHNIFALILGWMPFDLTNITKHRGLGNPLSPHKEIMPLHSRGMMHKRVYTIRFVCEFLTKYGFGSVKSYGTGYAPLPWFLGRLDKTHSQFIIVSGVKR